MSEISLIEYLRTLLSGEAIRDFKTLSESIGSITKIDLNQIIMGLGTYFFQLMPFPRKIVRCDILCSNSRSGTMLHY